MYHSLQAKGNHTAPHPPPPPRIRWSEKLETWRVIYASGAKVCFYLGANSPTGFYSLYDQLLEPEQAETIYILKGGPGCGKSSLMRRVAQAMEEKGASVEYIACSGDPDSLDAVVFPALNTAIVDGTAPHG